MLRRMRRCWWICVLIAAFGCDTLGEFSTGDGEVYRGEIAGVNDPTNCPDGIGAGGAGGGAGGAPGIDCSFIRRGFPSGVTLDLTFDPEQQYENPGTISTSGEVCDPTFTDTPLLPIPPLAHDQLGLYEFPGGGRIRNYMFVARPESGPLAGRDAMVFLSLLRGGSIELRLIAGPGLVICDPADCAAIDAGQCDYFGVFGLSREQL